MEGERSSQEREGMRGSGVRMEGRGRDGEEPRESVAKSDGRKRERGKQSQ